LSHRGHKVFCNKQYSDVKYIDIGVPQGTVLGPTLFLLYVNDINNYLDSATCNLYADDVLLYVSGQNINEINEKLQVSVNKVKEWYDNNILVVNASKSNTLLVATRQKEVHVNGEVSIHFGNDRLDNVDSCKYLGVEIDKNINWSSHIDNLCKDLNSKVWSLSRAKSFVPRQVLLDMYKSLIQPKIDYAITVWGYTTDQNLDRIQLLQNRAARVICNNFDFVNTRGINLVADLKLMNVRQRRDYFMALLVFKSIHGTAPDYLCNEIIMAVEVTNRISRNLSENDLYMPDTHIDVTRHAFSYCGPKIWNSMPEYIKECSSLYTFKHKAREYFMNHDVI
jgi:hypothetical protein